VTENYFAKIAVSWFIFNHQMARF